MVDLIKERAKGLAEMICDETEYNGEIRLTEWILEALHAQDAESRKAQREACAEAASKEVMRESLEHPIIELDDLCQAVHAACMDAEVKG
jgi:hypothetical protein